MTVRAYISNLSPRWPVERQEAEHAAHTPGWPDVPTFRDILAARKRVGHSPADLKARAALMHERGSLLRPSSRRSGETICVASLAVLAVSAEDFMAVCAAAAGRKAVIEAHETETRIEPGAGAAALSAAVTAFRDSRRRSNIVGEKWKPGAAASVAKRQADVAARIALFAEDWAKREIPTSVLLLRGGKRRKGGHDIVPMSYQTAAKILGMRPVAQKKREVDLYREQRRQEARERIATHLPEPDLGWLDDVMEEGK